MTTSQWLAAATCACVASLHGAVAAAQVQDLTKLSLEDLLNTEITSVSRKEQTLSRTAAAVYVITQEDIRRSGATTIPDLLRMAPGFNVAQLGSSLSAVTARGFNGLYANKLLVLIDGRSIYSPMFGGVHWEMQNLPLTEIDRIELIRGPGGTVWGANAVNGVINIITKPADETQGGEVTAGFGGQQRALSEARFGGRAGDSSYYRIFGRYSKRDSGMDMLSDANAALGGVRFDWRGEVDQVFAQGSFQSGASDNQQRRPVLAPPFSGVRLAPIDFSEGNAVVSWTRSPSSRGERSVRGFYQGYEREYGGLSERWRVFDLDGRQRAEIGRRHEVVAGLGYRYAAVDVGSVPLVTFANPGERSHLVTAFGQDEIDLGKGVRITPGSKLEHNSHSGVELQPSIRGTWTPTDTQAVWAAVSRAVRTPAKLDRDLRVPSAVAPGPGGVPLLFTVEGSASIDSEDVKAVEAGYRWQYAGVAVDLAVFRNGYDDLKGTKLGAPRPGSFEGSPVVVMPLTFANLFDATATGTEVSGTASPRDWWKMSGSYSWMRLQTRRIDDLPGAAPPDGSVPRHQFHLRTFLDLPGRVEASGLLYGGSAIPALSLPASRKLDLRLAWRASRRFEIAMAAQNLLHDGVIEYTDTTAPIAVPVKRTAFGAATWRF